MFPLLWTALTLVVVAGFWLPAAVSAEPKPTPSASLTPAAASRLRTILDMNGHPLPAHPAASVDGVVTNVKYGSGLITVHAGDHHDVEIVVLPSTTIVGKHAGFFTFSDLRRGAHVHVLMSERGGIFVAQMIDVR